MEPQDWSSVYLFLSPLRTKTCFPYSITDVDQMELYLQKDGVLVGIERDTLHKWRRHILDTYFAFPISPSSTTRTERYKIPKWVFYSFPVLSMMFTPLLRRVHENNLSLILKKHQRMEQHIQIGILWYQSRGWYVAENLHTGDRKSVV